MNRELKSILTLVILAVSGLSSMNVAAADTKARSNQFWWPDQLNLTPLRAHRADSSPYGEDFDYSAAFSQVDLTELKADVERTLKQSQDWWPADWGHYGGLMIRMAWHSAGTYRIHDGRGGADGGQLRFNPLNSWPDNANLDKARRLMWPVKQKYGNRVSWADLMILAGNVSLESMGFQTLGFAGGRIDDWEADLVYWGSETQLLANDKRYHKGKLEKPLGAVQMGLIYVNPEGPNANHDPLSAAADIRESFGRMAMNDAEIVALIAGGHTLGKAHGAHKSNCVGAEPAAAYLEEQDLGWKNKCGKGNAEDTVTSGLEGAWTATPTTWSHLYLDNLFRFDWVQQKSPAGATQWIPADNALQDSVPDAHVEGQWNTPIMFTTDLALKFDPGFREAAEQFWKNPEAFNAAFARAWFKLTHRDLGPRSRYLGSEVPEEIFIWQDPVPAVNHKLVGKRDIQRLKQQILNSGLTLTELITTAWASASTYRATDMRGGANGARLRLQPQATWAVNEPAILSRVLGEIIKIQTQYNNSASRGKQISLADLIVLGGTAAVEQAVQSAGYDIDMLFTPGRSDANQAMTDVASFAALEPHADAFRNYYSPEAYATPIDMLIEKADFLTLSVPEMTALLGGMRTLGISTGGSTHGQLTQEVGTLSNDFFVNLLDMNTQWSKSNAIGIYEGKDRASGSVKWTATPVDLIFGSNSELRAIAQAYAAEGGEALMIEDFVQAWSKVMMLDRFDIN